MKTNLEQLLSTATARPWAFYYSLNGLPGSDWGIYRDVNTGTGEPDGANHIAQVFGQHVVVNNANARLMVHAVNVLPVLVAALRDLHAAADDCLPMSGDNPVDTGYYASKIRAIHDAAAFAESALAAAEKVEVA